MKILGVSAFYHDSAACLLDDGRLVAAAQEERFTRIGFDPALPVRAARYCLEAGGIDIGGVDLVAFYEKPLLKLDRTLDTFLAESPRGTRLFADTVHTWVSERLRLPDLLRRKLGYRGPIAYSGHHASHAASAFFPSPFPSAAVLTVDGVGEWATGTIGHGRGETIDVLREMRFPHSVGLLYAAFTEFLGFAVLSDEYKVMGLAPYGEPRFAGKIRDELLDLQADGSFRLALEHFAFTRGEHSIDRAAFERIFGVAQRVPESELGQVHMDLARSIQAVTEEILLRQARFAHELTGERALCLAGGVALDRVANGRILREGPFTDLWVQPAAGDAGGCVGAAFAAWHGQQKQPRTPVLPDGMSGALLGPSPDDASVADALSRAGLAGRRLDPDAMDAEVAGLLADGRVVGWCDGRMEFGPRALGCRSILADPRRPEMQRRVNEKIKFREGFRPFAPAVPVDRAADWFTGIDLGHPSPYMLIVAPVAEGKRVAPEGPPKEGFERLHEVRSRIPAVTHVDGSARVQTVDPNVHPRFFRLLRAFERRTGCPVLLNTSLNLRGEPVVCTPLDAVRTFLASGMDALVLGPMLVVRPEKAPPPPPLPEVGPEPPDLRWFGAQLSLGLAILAGLLFWKGHSTGVYVAAAAGVTTGVLALAAPAAFAPIEPVWMRVANAISGFTARLLLGAVHLLLVVPLGLLRGRPAWAVRDRSAKSEWTVPEARPVRYDRMY